MKNAITLLHRRIEHRILSACLLVLASATPPGASTVKQDFDAAGAGTPFDTLSCVLPGRLPELLEEGPTGVGRFLRLGFDSPIPNHNAVSFDFVDPGIFDQVVVDFDFRMTPGSGQADGIGFALLDVEVPTFASGGICPRGPLFAAEEPNYTQSLGFGFDIHQAPGEDLNQNHVSIHYDGVEQAEFDVTIDETTNSSISLAGSEWIHATILVSPRKRSGIDVTITLQPRGQKPFLVVEKFPLRFVEPYKGRVHFAARSGGESATHDLDNVEVQFMDSTQSILSFDDVSYDVVESDIQAVVTVKREGNEADSVSVDYETMDASALGDSEYRPTSGRLFFERGDAETSVTVSLIDDDLNEGDETFLVALSNPSSSAVLGGPSVAGVRIVDDESARSLGHWSRIISLPTVAVHLHLLPTGRVLFWQEGVAPTRRRRRREDRGARDKIFLWDPVTGDVERAAAPPHDIFCSGHSFLPDGRLLVTGGHDARDGLGLPDATIYDPRRDAWVRGVPDMGGEGGRWYPTSITLGNGKVLVLSGSYDTLGTAPDLVFLKNTLPQVYDVTTNTWTDLTNARDLDPLGFDLYPRMVLAPNGRLFKVGDPDTWFLDVSGAGQWLAGPPSTFHSPRTYGPFVFDDGHVLQMGGGDPPTDSVELIDLNVADPAWLEMDPMASPRRHHNATVLPDGTSLVTGGTECAGFNCAAGAVLEAELWDPETKKWSTLAPMEIPRLYHSTAILLPDGRVLIAGGGRPAADGEVDNHNAELFSPPYLFKGPRPTILSAPPAASWGDTFLVETPDALEISNVTLVRLGSVTHAFDQNQRFLTLSASAAPGSVMVIMPSNPNFAPRDTTCCSW